MIKKIALTLFIVSALVAFNAQAHASKDDSQVLQLDYKGFTVWLDCDKRGAVKFEYVAHKDDGDLPRDSSFHYDLATDRGCQQTSTGDYGQDYDRGHQVPANHFDGDAIAIHQTNFITNILPQTKELNRGAWLQTEEIIQCYRESHDLNIFGGAIWDKNSNDMFLKSHGIRTPSFFWKVIYFNDGQFDYVISWIFQNSHDAIGHGDIDKYLVAVADIETLTGEKIAAIPDSVKSLKAKESWKLPRGCSQK